MTWNPTNANDVTLIISQVERDNTGTRTGTTEIARTNSIVVDDFSIDTDEDLSGLSGLGNSFPQGISQGDVDLGFSFTVQGEDAKLFNSLASDQGRAVELEIIAILDDYKDKLVGAFAGTRELSASSGDPVEYAAEGLATGRDPGTV